MKNNDLKPNYVGTFLTDVRFMLQTEDFVKALPPKLVQSLRLWYHSCAKSGFRPFDGYVESESLFSDVPESDND